MTGAALRRTLVIAGATGLAAARTVLGQTPDSLPPHTTLSAASMVRRLGVLTSDSLASRTTPSLGLERTARYVASEFQRFGLRPGSVEAGQGRWDTTWIQRYWMPGQQRVALGSSSVWLSARSSSRLVNEQDDELWRSANVPFRAGARFIADVGPQVVAGASGGWFGGLAENPWLVAGPHTVAAIRQNSDKLRHKIIFYIPPVGIDSVLRRQVLTELYTLGDGVLVVEEGDSADAVVPPSGTRPTVTLADGYLRLVSQARWPWAIEVQPRAIQGALSAAGELAGQPLDLAALRSAPAPLIVRVSTLHAWADLEADTTAAVRTAPNVVALLEGSDTLLKNEYLVLVAPLDSRQSPSRSTDSSGAADRVWVDDGSPLASLLLLAEAMSRPGARPRRSVLFLAASGDPAERERWGSGYFVQTNPFDRRLVAALALGRLGRTSVDVLIVDGLTEVELARSASLAAAQHPELGLALQDGGTAIRPSGNLFAFLRKAIPSISLHSALPADRAGSREGYGVRGAEQVDVETSMRMLQLIYAFTQAIANAKRPPTWSAEGRQRLSALLEQEGP